MIMVIILMGHHYHCWPSLTVVTHHLQYMHSLTTIMNYHSTITRHYHQNHPCRSPPSSTLHHPDHLSSCSLASGCLGIFMFQWWLQPHEPLKHRRVPSIFKNKWCHFHLRQMSPCLKWYPQNLPVKNRQSLMILWVIHHSLPFVDQVWPSSTISHPN